MGVPADPRPIGELERAGVSQILHWLPSAGRGRVEQAFDRWEAAAAEAQ